MGGDPCEPRTDRLTDPLDASALRARLRPVTARFAEASARTGSFLARRWPGYVAWSGGKDSTVVSHMAHLLNPTVPVVHYDCGADFPETLTYQDDLAASLGWRFERISVGSALDVMVDEGTWDHSAEGSGTDLFFDVAIAGPAAIARQRHGDAMLWGLRGEESKSRRALMGRTRGEYVTAGGTAKCSPIWDWAFADVMAYLAHHHVPPNPIYAKLAAMGCPIGGQRVSLVVDASGWARGRGVWLKRGWPDLYERYRAVLPRLAERS